MDWNVPTSSQANFPRVDIIDHENDIEVKAALPGVKKKILMCSSSIKQLP
jgi:HSP20 family protein